MVDLRSLMAIGSSSSMTYNVEIDPQGFLFYKLFNIVRMQETSVDDL